MGRLKRVDCSEPGIRRRIERVVIDLISEPRESPLVERA
jgi:hypothetical protein